MSFLTHLYPGDAGALLVAQVLVEATVVILSAAILARLGQRWNAGARHSIYLVALACVLACPLVSWAIQASGITLLALEAPRPTTVPSVELPTAEPSVNVPSPEPPLTAVAVEPIAAPIAAATEAPACETPPIALPLGGPDPLRTLGGGLVAVWLVGMLLLGLRWGHGQFVVARLRRSVEPLEEAALAHLLPQVRRALGSERLPALATSADLDRPVMIGLLRPLVILPEATLRTLPGPALVDVLIHECAHAVCRHQAVGALQRLAGLLFWPYPLIHLLNRELARAREEVCDNYVLRRSDAPRYARTLLELSQLLVANTPQPASLGLFHCRWKLENRIADLLDQRRKIMTGVNRKTAVILAALFLLSALPIAGLRLAEAASPERREVHRSVKDFPEKLDLSTPESAFAAWAQRFFTMEVPAINEVSWGKLDPASELLQDIGEALRNDPARPPIPNMEVVEILTYQDDLAMAVVKVSERGKEAYVGSCLGHINGAWKCLYLRVQKPDAKPAFPMVVLEAPSVQAAVEAFDSQKDELWKQFVEIRNEVLNGRMPAISETFLLGKASAAKKSTPKPPQWPRKAFTEGNWEISLALNMPQQSLQAVQYTVLDYDPIPTFLAEVKRMRSIWQETLSQQESELQKEAHRASQATVNWNSIFRSVKGDSVWLLTRGDGTSLSSNGADGAKWLVTKVVSVNGKPLCWCLPLAVKAGEQIRVVLNAENTYDLCGAYDKIMQTGTEPAASLDAAQLQKLVEEALAKQHPEITSRETIEWDKPCKADNGQMSIRYKYLAKFSGGETKIMNEIFSFDAQGKFVSLANVAGFPRAW